MSTELAQRRRRHCQITLALCGERSESATSNLLDNNFRSTDDAVNN